MTWSPTLAAEARCLEESVPPARWTERAAGIDPRRLLGRGLGRRPQDADFPRRTPDLPLHAPARAGLGSVPFSGSSWLPAEGRPRRELDLVGGARRWDAGLDDLGRQAAAVLPGVREEVARRLGWAYDGPPVEVALVGARPDVPGSPDAHLPTWAVGVALPPDPRIVIRTDLLAAGYGGGILPVLRHEWVHLAWGIRPGAHRRLLPLWVEEGLAEEVGGAVSVDAGAGPRRGGGVRPAPPVRGPAAGLPRGRRGADLAYKQ